MENSEEFNTVSSLDANPKVGYKIQGHPEEPRVILFTKTLGATVEDCIGVARDVVADHLRARSRGKPANVDVLINYRGISFSMLPNMSVEDGLEAYRKAKHRNRVGGKIALVPA